MARDAILPPLTDDCGVVFHHGERADLDPQHPNACLCGRYLNYLECPEFMSDWDDLWIGGEDDGGKSDG